MIAKIIRTREMPEYAEGFFTLIKNEGHTSITFNCDTLEPEEGKRIPAGKYEVWKVTGSKSFDYNHLWIKNVPERTHIKIHRLNHPEESDGCIGVGDLRTQGKIPYLDNSGKTLQELYDLLPDAFYLEIKSKTHEN